MTTAFSAILILKVSMRTTEPNRSKNFLQFPWIVWISMYVLEISCCFSYFAVFSGIECVAGYYFLCVICHFCFEGIHLPIFYLNHKNSRGYIYFAIHIFSQWIIVGNSLYLFVYLSTHTTPSYFYLVSTSLSILILFSHPILHPYTIFLNSFSIHSSFLIPYP